MEKYVNIDGIRYYKMIISLTGDDSHEVLILPGQGSFDIGVKGISKGHVDVWVNKDDIINWDSFNLLGNNFGDVKGIESCIDWPRFFCYTGNDTGFIKWSMNRKIEYFRWYPQTDMDVDFTNSNIDSLFIHEGNHTVKLSLGDSIRYLDLYDNISNYIIKKCDKVPSLGFYPIYGKNQSSYKLPVFECFRETTEVLIKVRVNDAPFDCSSLLQFPNLELLHIIGNVTNLESLKELKYLKKLGVWDVPNLSGFPSLSNWNYLDKFVAMNIDESIGKRLRRELSDLKKKRKFEFCSVTKLRSKTWFETEYDIPFSNWPEKQGKKAIRAYKICVSKVKDAKDENVVKNAIIEFISKINSLEDIETIEREDTYNSLYLIMKNSNIEIGYDKLSLWFDETRDF